MECPSRLFNAVKDTRSEAQRSCAPIGSSSPEPLGSLWCQLASQAIDQRIGLQGELFARSQ
jgi:hypothetical protein